MSLICSSHTGKLRQAVPHNLFRETQWSRGLAGTKSLLPVQHPGHLCPGLLTPTLVSTAMEQCLASREGFLLDGPCPSLSLLWGHPDSQPVDYEVAPGTTLVVGSLRVLNYFISSQIFFSHHALWLRGRSPEEHRYEKPGCQTEEEIILLVCCEVFCPHDNDMLF